MKMQLLLKPNGNGDIRAYPVPQEDLDAMLERGEIEKQPGIPVTYRIKAVVAKMVEDEVDVPQTYSTRDMVAAKRLPRMPRR